MTATELETDLRELVAELAELDPEGLAADTPFAEAGIDSLLAMEVAVHVEKRYGVRFEDAEVKHVRSLADLAALVREHGGG